MAAQDLKDLLAELDDDVLGADDSSSDDDDFFSSSLSRERGEDKKQSTSQSPTASQTPSLASSPPPQPSPPAPPVQQEQPKPVEYGTPSSDTQKARSSPSSSDGQVDSDIEVVDDLEDARVDPDPKPSNSTSAPPTAFQTESSGRKDLPSEPQSKGEEPSNTEPPAWQADFSAATSTSQTQHVAEKLDLDWTDWKSVFNAFDTNGDGKIDMEELIDGFKHHPNLAVLFSGKSRISIHAAVSQALKCDADGDGNITWEEFNKRVSIHSDAPSIIRHKLASKVPPGRRSWTDPDAMFVAMDSNGDKVITVEELTKGLSEHPSIGHLWKQKSESDIQTIVEGSISRVLDEASTQKAISDGLNLEHFRAVVNQEGFVEYFITGDVTFAATKVESRKRVLEAKRRTQDEADRLSKSLPPMGSSVSEGSSSSLSFTNTITPALVTCKVIKATGLQSKPERIPDPYLTVAFGNQNPKKSRVRLKTCDPEWGDMLVFDYPAQLRHSTSDEPNRAELTLRLAVYDCDLNRRPHASLGRASVDVGGLRLSVDGGPTVEKEMWVDLEGGGKLNVVVGLKKSIIRQPSSPSLRRKVSFGQDEMREFTTETDSERENSPDPRKKAEETLNRLSREEEEMEMMREMMKKQKEQEEAKKKKTKAATSPSPAPTPAPAAVTSTPKSTASGKAPTTLKQPSPLSSPSLAQQDAAHITVEKLFRSLDIDGDNRISMDELVKGLRVHPEYRELFVPPGVNPTHQAALSHALKIDVDADGFISWEEFQSKLYLIEKGRVPKSKSPEEKSVNELSPAVESSHDKTAAAPAASQEQSPSPTKLKEEVSEIRRLQEELRQRQENLKELRESLEVVDDQSKLENDDVTHSYSSSSSNQGPAPKSPPRLTKEEERERFREQYAKALADASVDWNDEVTERERKARMAMEKEMDWWKAEVRRLRSLEEEMRSGGGGDKDNRPHDHSQSPAHSTMSDEERKELARERLRDKEEEGVRLALKNVEKRRKELAERIRKRRAGSGRVAYADPRGGHVTHGALSPARHPATLSDRFSQVSFARGDVTPTDEAIAAINDDSVDASASRAARWEEFHRSQQEQSKHARHPSPSPKDKRRLIGASPNNFPKGSRHSPRRDSPGRGGGSPMGSLSPDASPIRHSHNDGERESHHHIEPLPATNVGSLTPPSPSVMAQLDKEGFDRCNLLLNGLTELLHANELVFQPLHAVKGIAAGEAISNVREFMSQCQERNQTLLRGTERLKADHNDTCNAAMTVLDKAKAKLREEVASRKSAELEAKRIREELKGMRQHQRMLVKFAARQFKESGKVLPKDLIQTSWTVGGSPDRKTVGDRSSGKSSHAAAAASWGGRSVSPSRTAWR